jgi:hypothetical protein
MAAWSTFAFFAGAPVLVVIGIAMSIWGIGKSLYILSEVPDRPRPASADLLLAPSIIPAQFARAGFSLQSVLDLILGGLFVFIGGSTIVSKSAECLKLFSEWGEIDPNQLMQCFLHAIFPLVGAGLIVYHFMERKREAALVRVGYVVRGFVTAIESGGKSGTHVSYEYPSLTGEMLAGDFTRTVPELQEGDEILILVDPADSEIHRAIPSLRFYELKPTPIFEK